MISFPAGVFAVKIILEELTVDFSKNKEEVEMNDKQDSHQMRHKGAKKLGKGN